MMFDKKTTFDMSDSSSLPIALGRAGARRFIAVVFDMLNLTDPLLACCGTELALWALLDDRQYVSIQIHLSLHPVLYDTTECILSTERDPHRKMVAVIPVDGFNVVVGIRIVH